MIVKGGRTNYGEAIGILMLDTKFPRIPGDIGNALTFDFPVKYKKVKGATSQRVVREADPSLIAPFIEAARELEEEGVSAITTSCGFLAIFHEYLADAVSIPVFTSSLLQVPIVFRMLKKGQKVGIMTASKPHLTELHFKGAGIKDIPLVIYGMEEQEEFPAVFLDQKETLDIEKAESEMVQVATKMVSENPDVGAIVFECTNMPPFRKAVQQAVNLPVFDIVTLMNYVYDSVIACR
ncbi:aspartate/glutamate racemase family protein [Biomaibacter acetigenes]|uniref:Aspartate/glutamate racemase family protein n=1 Tax=Biomaibacter acetigenes TaxID=2316383 RepID=A0A3G2R6W4_9FIRM|nr:aspartate/glutamate racemase family protein [Biomaibacter acetigenes]AYO31123.1 aspartate/glutamate racemase family protein [Biomaibacter acetigenes]